MWGICCSLNLHVIFIPAQVFYFSLLFTFSVRMAGGEESSADELHCAGMVAHNRRLGEKWGFSQMHSPSCISGAAMAKVSFSAAAARCVYGYLDQNWSEGKLPLLAPNGRCVRNLEGISSYRVLQTACDPGRQKEATILIATRDDLAKAEIYLPGFSLLKHEILTYVRKW